MKLDVVDLPPDHWDVMMAGAAASAQSRQGAGAGGGRTLARRWSGKPDIKAPDQAGALNSLDARSDSVAGLEG